MKVGHAIALALVGWYLMMPPGNITPNVDAPLNQWSVFEPLDSAAQCQAERLRFYKLPAEKSANRDARQAATEVAKEGDQTVAVETAFKRLRSLVCVATDDPRLKGK